MSEVDGVEVVLEDYFESQAVVELAIVHLRNLCARACRLGCLLFLPLVTVIRDVEALALPTYIPLLSILRRIEERFHPALIRTLALQHVHDVESVALVFPCVTHLKEIPLGEALGAVIIFHIEVVLKISYLHYSLQVSALETALEY